MRPGPDSVRKFIAGGSGAGVESEHRRFSGRAHGRRGAAASAASSLRSVLFPRPHAAAPRHHPPGASLLYSAPTRPCGLTCHCCCRCQPLAASLYLHRLPHPIHLLLLLSPEREGRALSYREARGLQLPARLVLGQRVPCARRTAEEREGAVMPALLGA
jgi:hypothetical protein